MMGVIWSKTDFQDPVSRTYLIDGMIGGIDFLSRKDAAKV
jgi:hypothetical protein